MLPRLFSTAGGALLVLGFAWPAPAQEEAVTIEMKTTAGLRFEPPRFAVPPGAKVKLEIENADDMAHNFVLVRPGTRMEVVTAATTLPMTPEQTFIPPAAPVLAHSPVLVPGTSATLEFTAPAEEGVYPFVCTYPGHGFVMYGAMYISARGEAALPPLAEDPQMPDVIREQAKNLALHAYPPERPMWYRIFLRDSGPASIAVALPGGQNFCWDAGACRLRYAWRGGFVDPMPHWRGNGDGFAEVPGTIYYRPSAFPLRFGESRKAPEEVRFRGYDIVDGLPEFRYEIGAITVRERIQAQHHGGIEAVYQITGAKNPVYFVGETGAGAELTASAGKFADGVLKLSAAQAKKFTVSFTEIPRHEALGYWSMNDILDEKQKKAQPVAGVKGRALVFDGEKAQFPTGLKTGALTTGATFCVWAQLTRPAAADQAYIGARSESGEFTLGANLAGLPGFGVRVKNPAQELRVVAAMPLEADDRWRHLAATLGGNGLRFYLDGKPAGHTAGAELPAEAEFFLGSNGQSGFAGATLDEARIYARVLEPKEIAQLYEADRAESKLAVTPTAATPTKGAASPTPKAAGKKPAATPTPSKKTKR